MGGWTGAGALTAAGLLAAILAWLGGKHLPAKDKQFGDMIKDKDAILQKLVTDKDATIAEKDRQIDRILAMWNGEREKEREARHTIASLYQTGLADVHERYAAEAKAERASIETRAVAERAAQAKEMAEMRDLLRQNMAGFRQAVHDVKDAAQTTMSKVALAQAEAKQSGT